MTTNDPRPPASRAVAVAVAAIVVASLHHVTSPSRIVLHELFNYLLYVPIIFAAYWYGIAGGLGIAVLSSAIFIPHIRIAWASNPAYAASQYAQVAVFHLLGITVGWLTASQRRLTQRYRGAAESLERANRELQQSQDDLRRAERLSAVGEIAAGLAHEIKSPLAGIKGALEIIEARATDGSPEAEFARIGAKELARLDALVRDFLLYARPRDPEVRPVKVAELLDQAVAVLRTEIDRKQLTLTVEHSAMTRETAVRVDPEQLTEVILNVLVNAIQASPTRGSIHARDNISDGSVSIDIADQGPGIAPEHLPRIFDPFFTTKTRGTGLGLAISHRIVAAHHGTISTHPASPTGTIFRIRLPLST